MRATQGCALAFSLLALNAGSIASAQGILGATVTAIVEEEVDGVRAFRYTVANSQVSTAAVGMIELTLQCSSAEREWELTVDSPSGWLGAMNQAGATWAAIEEQNEIPAGASQDGFVLRSEGLPGICIARLSPVLDVDTLDIPVPPVEKELPNYFAAVRQFQDRRSVTVTTIGPVAANAVQTPSVLLFSLEQAMDQAQAAGWFRNRGAYQSVLAKLSAARRAVDRRNSAAARGELAALLNYIDAQTGKQVSSEVSALLRSHLALLLAGL